jgi:hypothetical protein
LEGDCLPQSVQIPVNIDKDSNAKRVLKATSSMADRAAIESGEINYRRRLGALSPTANRDINATIYDPVASVMRDRLQHLPRGEKY